MSGIITIPSGLINGPEDQLEKRPGERGIWFLLHIKSHQEKMLSEALCDKGIGHYLPMRTRQRQYGGRRVVTEMPLFPGYLFLYGSHDEAYWADRTKRVVRIITVVDQGKLVEELKSIHLALRQKVELDPYPYLRKGVRVVVTGGPLRGVRGTIENYVHRHRLVLQVSVLGQAVSVEVDGAMLEPIEDIASVGKQVGACAVGSLC